MTLGIAIVTYNSADVIGRCLDACRRFAPDAAIAVVDNASSDGTPEQAASHVNVQLARNRHNRGFAAAANQAIASLDTEFVLLLNPDVELATPLTDLLEAMRSAEVAVAAGRLVGPDNRTQTGFTIRRFPTPAALAFEALGINRILPGNPINRRYRYLDRPHDAPGPVEQPAGAFLLIRKAAWQRLRGFDEDFHPLWFEDVDFLLRAQEAGFSVTYVPSVVARHGGAHSVRKLEWGCREVTWYASLLRYASKHFRPSGCRGVSAAVVLGSALRAVLGIFQHRSLKPISTYATVIRLAGECLWSGRIPQSGAWPGYRKAVG